MTQRANRGVKLQEVRLRKAQLLLGNERVAARCFEHIVRTNFPFSWGFVGLRCRDCYGWRARSLRSRPRRLLLFTAQLDGVAEASP